MKTNMRHYATIAAVASAFAFTAVAQAQNNFGFFWKVNYNGLNQSGMWQEQNTADIPGGIGGTTKVQLWVRNTPVISIVNIQLGWGDATASGAGANRVDAAQRLRLAGLPLTAGGAVTQAVWSNGVSFTQSAGANAPTYFTGGGGPSSAPDTNFSQRGGRLAATTTSTTEITGIRPWGLHGGIVPVGGPQSVGNNGVMLLELTVQNNNMPLFSTAQMVVWGSGNFASNTTYVANGATRTQFNGTVPLTFRAVPEPGTMIALGAGIAALVARRRKKA
ncbi:MAG TPA: PEP-CTERM sorting domain-containing protein [Fimbriimonadaceae bacterium]|nr:PEP-CTERM sorting domain-containing protein [Fimbriimonadaceae bacterium]HRJ32079.1 PEP-CTERM sorting domain-containing protein [Fimbriimonadaceae bacterium]